MKPPKHFIIYRIILIVSTIASVAFLITLIIKGLNDNLSTLFLCGCVIFALLAFTAAANLLAPKFKRMKKETELYTRQLGKDVESEYFSLDADIRDVGRRKRASSFSSGFKTKTCPKCGDLIDSNETFCSNCGTVIFQKCEKCKTVNQAGDKFCRSCGNKLTN